MTVSFAAKDANGADDIDYAEAVVYNRSYRLEKIVLNNSTVMFAGKLKLLPTDNAGNNSIEILVYDSNGISSRHEGFWYMELLSSVIEKSYIHFSGIKPGDISSIETLNIKNSGNVDIQTELMGADLSSGKDSIPAGSLEVEIENRWEKLSGALLAVGSSIGPDEESSIRMRLAVPENIMPGDYSTALRIVSRKV